MPIITFIIGVTLMADSASPAPLPALTDKALIAWVTVGDPNSRGGSVLTIDDRQTHFDGIIFGELSPAKWMAGSDLFRRTCQQQGDWPTETAGPETLVQVAIVYEGRTITVYRDGELYSRHEVPETQAFPPSSAAVFGLRHIGAGQPCHFAGSIEEARIYAAALTQDQIRALRINTLSDPSPAAWWDFEEGTPTEKMGAFPEGRLGGNAEIRDGRLQLDGINSFMLTPASAVPLPPADVPEWPSPVHYRPARGVFADPIPFFRRGEYNVFYLQGGVGKVPWKHIVSTDLVHWKELPDALVSDGDPNGPDGEHMFTGSVTEKDGTFHAFYTGWNPRNPGGQECVMHATSRDLITWTRHPEAVIRPDGVVYKSHQAANWRDPYVFYNEEEQQWWMVMCSDTQQGEGGVGLLTSQDLWDWKHESPLKADMQECPDLFKIGDTWYLIGGDHYSSSKSARGPYVRSPGYDVIDRPGVYAGKRQFDGKRHVWTGWAWDIPGRRDGEPGTWGGSQCVPRELYPGPEGRLYGKPVAEAVSAFGNTVLDLAQRPPVAGGGGWRLDEGALVGAPSTCAFEAPAHYLLEAEVRLERGTRLTVVVRQQESGEGYRLCLDTTPQGPNGNATLSGPGFTYARKWPCDPDRPVKLQVFVQGTLIEAFINDAVAMTCRAYDFQTGKLGLEVSGGAAKVTALRVKEAG
jgi:beta-fructofuranosidase